MTGPRPDDQTLSADERMREQKASLFAKVPDKLTKNERRRQKNIEAAAKARRVQCHRQRGIALDVPKRVLRLAHAERSTE